jgi:two-component system, OmpR family, sensor histidine kinase ArlS
MKLTLQKKIVLWFLIILIISLILYGFLIYFVYEYNLRGERYIIEVDKHLEGADRIIIERLREVNKFEPFGLPPNFKIIPPVLFLRIFYTLTGGIIVIIIIDVLGGFFVQRRMLHQINVITENVKEIDEKRLHLRLNLKGEDAISNMARVFDNMLDKIEASFKKQKQFIQSASHELNTPLTVIKTKIDTMRQKRNVTGKEYAETIDLIDSEVMRLSKIAEELLILYDIEENKGKTEFGKVDLKEAMEKILTLFNNQIKSKELQLKKSYKGNFTVKGSDIQIEQLLFNLIDNAIKYSISSGKLDIKIENDKDINFLVLTISNISKEINEKDLSDIFKRFYRTGTGGGRKSFGLGLSISKKIVENHNGTIRVDYNRDKSEVSFKVNIPLFSKEQV